MAVFPGSKYSYFVVLAADIICFITGTSIAWSSPMIALLEDDDTSKIPIGRQITKDEESWIGSLMAMGGIFGPFIFQYIVQHFGRKITVASISLPFAVAYLISAFAETVWLFYLARIFMGFGVSGMFSILPIFVAETVEDVNRGLLQASTTASIMLGLLFSYSLGPFVSIMVFNLVLLVICFVYVPIFWLIAPETPYYLVSVNKEEKALKSLKYLRRKPSEDVKNELEAIRSHLQQLQKGSFVDIFKDKATIKAFFISVALTTFQQFSGVTCILSFVQNIFDATGSDIPPEICSIIVGAVQFIVSCISPPFLDKIGRKILLQIAVTGAIISEVVLGVYFHLQDRGDDVSNIGWLPVLSMVGFITSYNFGIGSIPWATMGELLPLNVISKAATLTTSFYWFTGFFLTKYFGSLADGIGLDGTFWLFAGFCVLFDIFVYFFLFETKGKSLSEIQAILNK